MGTICKACGGVAEKTLRKCSFQGCTNQAQNGGRCKRHGAKVKACTYEGCTKQVERGGFCVRHGAERGIRHGTRIKDCKENSDDGSRKEGERSMINIEAGNIYAGKD